MIYVSVKQQVKSFFGKNFRFKKIAFPFSSDCQRNCRRYWEGIVGVFQSDTDGEFKTTPTVTAHLKKRLKKSTKSVNNFLSYRYIILNNKK